MTSSFASVPQEYPTVVTRSLDRSEDFRSFMHAQETSSRGPGGHSLCVRLATFSDKASAAQETYKLKVRLFLFYIKRVSFKQINVAKN